MGANVPAEAEVDGDATVDGEAEGAAGEPAGEAGPAGLDDSVDGAEKHDEASLYEEQLEQGSVEEGATQVSSQVGRTPELNTTLERVGPPHHIFMPPTAAAAVPDARPPLVATRRVSEQQHFDGVLSMHEEPTLPPVTDEVICALAEDLDISLEEAREYLEETTDEITRTESQAMAERMQAKGIRIDQKGARALINKKEEKSAQRLNSTADTSPTSIEMDVAAAKAAAEDELTTTQAELAAGKTAGKTAGRAGDALTVIGNHALPPAAPSLAKAVMEREELENAINISSYGNPFVPSEKLGDADTLAPGSHATDGVGDFLGAAEDEAALAAAQEDDDVEGVRQDTAMHHYPVLSVVLAAVIVVVLVVAVLTAVPAVMAGVVSLLLEVATSGEDATESEQRVWTKVAEDLVWQSNGTKLIMQHRPSTGL